MLHFFLQTRELGVENLIKIENLGLGFKPDAAAATDRSTWTIYTCQTGSQDITIQSGPWIFLV